MSDDSDKPRRYMNSPQEFKSDDDDFSLDSIDLDSSSSDSRKSTSRNLS